MYSLAISYLLSFHLFRLLESPPEKEKMIIVC